MTLDEIKQLFATHRIDKVKLGGFDVDGVLRGSTSRWKNSGQRLRRAWDSVT